VFILPVNTTSVSTAQVIGVTFLTPAPAPDLIENLHSHSCLNSENLKAMYILPHEAK